MFEFLSRLCSKHKNAPLETELRRQRKALKAIDKFVHSIQKSLKYWERSGKSLRVGINGYFYDKPVYKRPVEEIGAALDSFKTISSSVKPQVDLIKEANVAAAKSIAKVEKASKRKKDAEKKLLRKEAALKKLQQKAETGKDPQAVQKVKTAEDEVQIARNRLQTAEAELVREMQQTMNGSAPEAAMQVARALEAMILFLVGSGVDVASVRASIRLLEETQYVSPLTAAGHQQQQLQQQPYTSSKVDMQQMQQFPNSPRSTSPAEPMKRTNSQSSRPHSPSDPGSQQVTPRKPYPSGDSQRLQPTASNGNLNDSARPLASPTNPFASD
ncbi:hypothetical protein, conserved [Eimeria tenella]|uniref:Uncharacterized protein n=1 Tax=Eimeria tenella TaxID=5802 RepID=U6KJ47_EIMTE|nr:hypothetical protein, conserved [Eimeria tenella]CDJ37939.1 hypothetical protein, conserved [Eimeria tenella]|eukprot:XP_013228777.1 hypothetical protein, conserved [Eimeria tenella]